MMIAVDASRRETLTDQIVSGIQRLVEQRLLRPDTRLPSIRRFAAAHRISKFTVAQAYDRLVASGHVHSRRGSGFYVSGRERPLASGEAARRLERVGDVLWLMRQQARESRYAHLPGSGWLPASWLEDSGLDRAMRAVSRLQARNVLGAYGDPRGFPPLRESVSRRLTEMGIAASPDQVLLTIGVSGAVDLVGRYLVRPNDVVFVDDPGLFQTFGHMRTLGAVVHGVPWTGRGPDLEHLESMARTHQPRLFITTSIVQNPTGFSIGEGTAFRLLQLAERFDFHIIENDVDGPCHPSPPPRLASLDQLNRVVYVNGYSKVLSPRLRVGFVAGHRDLIQDLVDLKMLTQAASSELTERMVHEVIVSGHYRRHRAKLMSRLERARQLALHRLEAIGFGPAESNTDGLFAWMEVPGLADTRPLAEAAVEYDMLLAPGAMFSPDLAPSTKMRFNVAHCHDDEVFRRLETLLNSG